MPKGRHKGLTRRFTNFNAEELKSEKEQRKQEWRAQRGELSSDEEGSSGSGSGSESGSEDEGDQKERKPKGVSGLIEFENPNRPAKPVKVATKKANEVDPSKVKAPELTRRQREEKARQHYEAMHAAGKTDQARADLERLALIREKRAEAERKKKELAEAKGAAGGGDSAGAKAAASKKKQKS